MAKMIGDAGFPLTLWARRPASLEAFVGSNAEVVETPLDVGRRSDVLCICVVADDDVDEVLRGPIGALARMKPGGIVVVHSTVHPRTCLRLQEDYPGLAVLDAPVSGGADAARSRTLLVMVGGNAAPVDQCRPVFAAFANVVVHVGPLGSGQEAKLLNNVLFAAQLGLVADLFAVATLRGLDREGLTTVLRNGSGRSFALDVLARSQRDLPAMASTAGPLLAKDVGTLGELIAPLHPRILRAAEEALSGMGVSHSKPESGEP
jgi:3-hydroxyisobutyrate dehydrogenase-like beta-hydroxyacid dehydrogenase